MRECFPGKLKLIALAGRQFTKLRITIDEIRDHTQMPGFLVPLLPDSHSFPRKSFRIGESNPVDARKLADRQISKTTTDRLSDVCSDPTVCTQNDEPRQCRC
jgi:hypothetical protein